MSSHSSTNEHSKVGELFGKNPSLQLNNHDFVGESTSHNYNTRLSGEYTTNCIKQIQMSEVAEFQ